MTRIKAKPSHLYQDLPCKIIQFYRGRLSQSHFSKKLGYKYNSVYRWESNIKPISWAELINIVATKKIN